MSNNKKNIVHPFVPKIYLVIGLKIISENAFNEVEQGKWDYGLIKTLL